MSVPSMGSPRPTWQDGQLPDDIALRSPARDESRPRQTDAQELPPV